MAVLRGHSISRQAKVVGEALVTTDLVAFLGSIDFKSGEIVELGHQARGQNIADKILVCPGGKGGCGDPFGFYFLYKSGKAPKAIITMKVQPTMVAGALITNTPMVYGFQENIVELLNTGDIISVDGDRGEVELIKKA
jgi:predicted aconitase with swiveling domain